ncbi:MAG: RNA-binding S4 domain-containing protein [bacterium]|nr:RNA-binding S4 domain-containing protein [bacterium]MDI1335319.1 RNA-binding S4 domain-containing protein [Lacunisphaera sp.]
MKQTSSSTPRPVKVRAVPIELCQFLKFGGLAESGGAAKQAISEGLVLLNGVVETQKRKQLQVGDQVGYGSHIIIVALP